MKRMLAFLFTLLLLCPAALADVQSQVKAPAHVTDTFQSNAGKTVVSIDADVTVPDVDKIPIYLISPRLFSSEEMIRAANVLFGGRDWIGTSEYSEQAHTAYDGSVSTIFQAAFGTVKEGDGLYFPVPVSVMNVQGYRLTNGMMQNTFIRYSRWNEQLLDTSLPHYDVEGATQLVTPADGRQPNGCGISMEKAKEQAEAIVARIAPHMVYAGCGIKAENPRQSLHPGQYSTDIDPTGLREAWVFYYTPMYDLPCNFAVSGLATYNYSVRCREESLCIIMDDEGCQDLYWYQPYDIVGTLQKDCSLLPFDSVMQVARSILPLTLASYEREGTGARAWITDIRLGYLRVMRPDQPDTLMLIPVWDFYGNVAFNGSYVQNWACHSWLTINAIDGTVIDRQYGY
jgi:hypothetical protein